MGMRIRERATKTLKTAGAFPWLAADMLRGYTPEKRRTAIQSLMKEFNAQDEQEMRRKLKGALQNDVEFRAKAKARGWSLLEKDKESAKLVERAIRQKIKDPAFTFFPNTVK